jgi:hypothetical protein
MKPAIMTLLLLGVLSANPARAQGPGCVCKDGYAGPGGATCTLWDCDPVLRMFPFTPVKSATDCPDNRQLFCDGKVCALGCPVEQKAEPNATKSN